MPKNQETKTDMRTSRIIMLMTLMCLPAGLAKADKTPEDANPPSAPETPPAEAFKLPAGEWPTQIVISPNGHHMITVQARATYDSRSTICHYNLADGDSFDISVLLPDYQKLNKKTQRSRLLGIGNDGKGLITIETFAGHVGSGIPKNHRFLIVDVKRKKLLSDKTPTELAKKHIFHATRTGDEWLLLVMTDKKLLEIIAVDSETGGLRTLPYKGACIGAFDDGDLLLAVDPDKPDQEIENIEIKKRAWLVKLNPKTKALKKLTPFEECTEWSHLTRMSADAKRLAICFKTETDGHLRSWLRVLDISDGKKDPPVLWEKEIPGDRQDWPIMLPIGVTNDGTLLLLERGQRKIVTMKADGSTNVIAQNVDFYANFYRYPFVTPNRLWYVQQSVTQEPATLHAIDIEAIDKTAEEQQTSTQKSSS